jgi:hypothetical protein
VLEETRGLLRGLTGELENLHFNSITWDRKMGKG